MEELYEVGIRTAANLRDADPDLVDKMLTVVGWRIQQELRGQSKLALEEIPPDKQQIIRSRSFGRPVFLLGELEQAVAQYITRAAEELRKQKVYVATEYHGNEGPTIAEARQELWAAVSAHA